MEPTEISDDEVTPTVAIPAIRFEPEPAQEEPEAEESKQQAASEPQAPQPARVALRVFLKVHGARWDQLAGFKSYAQRQQLGPMSVAAWREAYQAFMAKPV